MLLGGLATRVGETARIFAVLRVGGAPETQAAQLADAEDARAGAGRAKSDQLSEGREVMDRAMWAYFAAGLTVNLAIIGLLMLGIGETW